VEILFLPCILAKKDWNGKPGPPCIFGGKRPEKINANKWIQPLMGRWSNPLGDSKKNSPPWRDYTSSLPLPGQKFGKWGSAGITIEYGCR